ncbi:GNAT family N-acetyltransferase [Rhodococcus sp. BP-252]|nr:GNAT family N-acetyltransferase [Rhodococcus sp. BP-320]MBY6418627.1 GNAT family N-acetyltransferase [Rhodococcus sp. BP-321]MBY6422922.1 GNAT family N-acetyltransferase [Rhodococcus sp. BP-324]MBY6428729.1 GNAT family N-acetyltransferase [Rhodococcus sp. BP-323]MBY6433748.1 GNAT family N-acetyltransferase [Rhodococcus sp. BP-322]MBY6442668.1 GNAT family N-acetyltransferase [Rhodococcus sp. BP-319]MBY6452347.1 GNAT family N-acetyltransferase [Rhodococcus sp. BP-315]MBY6462324.1 GNAT famil
MRHNRQQVRTVTATSPGGHLVTLRTARFSDAAAWRQIRLRDRSLIEPYWATTDAEWNERHTDAMWIHECLRGRADTAAGRALPRVIDVDGHFAGQCNLEWIDTWNGTAEVGIWVDSAHGRAGIGSTAAELMLDVCFTDLHLQRVSAPIGITNTPAKRLVAKIGLQHEGTMKNYMNAGGRRTDHELWAITADHHTNITRS